VQAVSCGNYLAPFLSFSTCWRKPSGDFVLLCQVGRQHLPPRGAVVLLATSANCSGRPGCGGPCGLDARREYVQIFKGFHRFLQVRTAAESEASFGVRLVCPVDEFNASRHVGDESPALLPPPTPERWRSSLSS
jgi:hypothetical protein